MHTFEVPMFKRRSRPFQRCNRCQLAPKTDRVTACQIFVGCLTLTYLCTAIILSFVLDNDIKRKPFYCRIQPSPQIGTAGILLRRYSQLNMTVLAPCKKYYTSYPSSKKWPFCPHPCCQLSPKKLESGHDWVVYIPLLTMENAIS